MRKVQIQIKTAYLWLKFQPELEENCDLYLEGKKSFAIIFWHLRIYKHGINTWKLELGWTFGQEHSTWSYETVLYDFKLW